MKTEEVIEALGKLYCAPAYAFLTQVRNGTGYERSARTADAMFMSLWPSRGIFLAGIEVKVSRTDWIKELKDPKKAEDLAKYCDYWYLAVGDETIVHDGELPETWGLIVPHKGGMKVIKQPTKLTSEPIDRVFLAAIMRNMAERTIARDVIQSELRRQYDLGVENGKQNQKYLQEDYNKLFNKVKNFEKYSGVEISGWSSDNKHIGLAVKDVLTGKDKLVEEKLGQLKERAINIVAFLNGEDVSPYKM